MSETEKDIEVDFDAVEKAGKEPDIKVEEAETVEKVEPQAISAEEGLEAFKKKYEEERQARIDAEDRARQAAMQAREAQGQVGDTNLQLVTSAIDTLKRETDILKANLRAAMASGDYSAAADAQEAMADTKAKLLQLENGKAALQEQLRNPVQRVEAPVDAVEALASQLSPRSAAWVRAHPEYARNPRLTQKMIAAHNLVTADGMAPDTDEYFESVERVLGVSAPPSASVAAAEEPMSAASAPAQRRSSPAAAPVSRSGNPGNSRPNVVRLSPQEREMAQMMGQSPEEYARNKLALIKAGKITAH
jgi:hypothetical protein